MPGPYGRKPENRDPQFAEFSDQRLKANGWSQAQIDAVVYKMDAETMGRYGHSQQDIKNYVQDTAEYKLTGVTGARDGYTGQEGQWDKTASDSERAPTAQEISEHNKNLKVGERTKTGSYADANTRQAEQTLDKPHRPATPQQIRGTTTMDPQQIEKKTNLGSYADKHPRTAQQTGGTAPATPQEIRNLPSQTGIPSEQNQKNAAVHAERTRIANQAKLDKQKQLNKPRQDKARAANQAQEKHEAAGGKPAGYENYSPEAKAAYDRARRNRSVREQVEKNKSWF